MHNHFDYLVKEDAADFFQKLAIDKAGVRASDVAPEAMAKIASAQSPFEKVAARLDRDLELLKVAGECGVNGGMMRRADAYMDVLYAHNDLSLEEYEQVFDKVAAHAIEVDLLAAYDQLCAEVPAGFEDLVDEVLIKAGHDLTELALMEKEAFRAAGLGRLMEGTKNILRRGGQGVAGVAGQIAGGGTLATKVRPGLSGAGAVARAAAQKAAVPFKAIGAAAKDVARAMGNKYRTARLARMARTRGELAAGLAAARAASSKPGIQGTTARAMGSSLERQMASRKNKAFEQASLEAQRTKESLGLSSKPSSSSPAAPAAAAKNPKAQADGGGGPPPAKEKPAAGGDSPERPRTMREGGAIPEPPGGTSGKPPGFMDAWRKATTKGWKALSDEERGTLIRGGVTAALVYRAVTGKGAVTGNEGIV